VTFKNAPDFETKDTYTFTATATDAAGNTATQEVIVNITNDACLNGDVITHNGTNYCPVTSPYTGKVWLDRNLGANRVCQDYNDTQCYGDYYQWGRNADGHEKSNSDTNITLATQIDPILPAALKGKFILNGSGDYDWASVDANDTNASPERVEDWNSTDGTNVCPEGYRVPTDAEFRHELTDGGSAQIDLNTTQKPGNDNDRRVNAANCFLKLPSAGFRAGTTGNMNTEGDQGAIWTINTQSNKSKSHSFNINASNAYIFGYVSRTHGYSVRCIKE
jgi:uncharacterized protein (TIGR02145 family)